MHRQSGADRFPPGTGPRSWRGRRISLNTPRPTERHRAPVKKIVEKACWKLRGRCPAPAYHWAAFWIVVLSQQVMKSARHKRHYCSCPALQKVPAPRRKNSMHRCHCQLMKKSQIIKINSRSTRALPKDDDDWKRRSERNLRGPWAPC